MPDTKFRDVEVIVENEILHRFDTSHKFWERYIVRNASLKKKLDYFSIENIDDPCMTTVTVNPKEYIETFKSEYVNKKHKELSKGALGMEFENYSRRIDSIAEIETFGQLSAEKQKQNRFTIKNNEMILQKIEKSKFAQINDKGIISAMALCRYLFVIPICMNLSSLSKTKNKTLNDFYRRKTINLSRWKNLR